VRKRAEEIGADVMFTTTTGSNWCGEWRQREHILADEQ
jgi:hypothetical protein